MAAGVAYCPDGANPAGRDLIAYWFGINVLWKEDNVVTGVCSPGGANAGEAAFDCLLVMS